MQGWDAHTLRAAVLGLESHGILFGRSGRLVHVESRGGGVEIVDVESAHGRALLASLVAEHIVLVRVISATAGVGVGHWRRRERVGPLPAPAPPSGAFAGLFTERGALHDPYPIERYPVELNVGPQGRGKSGPDVWQPVQLLRDAAPLERRVPVAQYPDCRYLKDENGGILPFVAGNEDARIAAGEGELILAVERLRGPDKTLAAGLKTCPTKAGNRARALRGVLREPALGAGGKILSTPGYDAASGWWIAPDAGMPADFSDLSTTAEAAKAAMERLLGYFDGVHTADERSRYALLADVLAGMSRPAWIHSPVLVIRAAEPGSGKGAAGHIVRAMGLGPHASKHVISWSTATEDEVATLASPRRS